MVRASARWVIVGVWRGCVVIVLSGFFRFGGCALLERSCGGIIVVCIVLRVFGGLNWACLYRLCCWWECTVPSVLL